MKTAISVVALLSLAGCVSWSQFDDGLNALVGRPISAAFGKIGYPNNEQTIAGRKIYRWGSSSQGMITMPTQTTTTGSVGNGLGYRPFTATTYGSAMIPVSYQCTLALSVNSQEIITGYSYDGELGGCEPYINALKAK